MGIGITVQMGENPKTEKAAVSREERKDGDRHFTEKIIGTEMARRMSRGKGLDLYKKDQKGETRSVEQRVFSVPRH